MITVVLKLFDVLPIPLQVSSQSKVQVHVECMMPGSTILQGQKLFTGIQSTETRCMLTGIQSTETRCM